MATTLIPSDRYFEVVKTVEDYNKLKASGMAWEVEPNLPNTWAEHIKIKELHNVRSTKSTGTN